MFFSFEKRIIRSLSLPSVSLFLPPPLCLSLTRTCLVFRRLSPRGKKGHFPTLSPRTREAAKSPQNETPIDSSARGPTSGSSAGLRAATVRSSATVVASLTTPSPKTSEKSIGALEGSRTWSTATESVAAKIAPRARQSPKERRRRGGSREKRGTAEAASSKGGPCPTTPAAPPPPPPAPPPAPRPATSHSSAATNPNAKYVPPIPRAAMTPTCSKKAFFRTESPAWRMIGGK